MIGDRLLPVVHPKSDRGGRRTAQLTYYADPGGSWDVYTVEVATGATRSLTNGPGFDGQPAWQPTRR